MKRSKAGNENKLAEEAANAEENSRIAYESRQRNRRLLKENEPVVFDVLNQALATNTVPHAYLFQGNSSALKTETAVLLAQSLFLKSDRLIDEEQLSDYDKSVAKRVAEGNHADYLFLGGNRKETISLDDVTELSRLFSQTAAEESGRKVYIISLAENMTNSAMNGLLKFLEEPAENVYAILTTDNVERILPTVLSRCVRITFHALDESVYERIAIEEGLDEEDAYLLSHIVTMTSGLADIAAGDAYQKAKVLFKQKISAEGDSRLLFTDYELKNKNTDKDKNLDMMQYFLSMCIQFEKDAVFAPKKKLPVWYEQRLEIERRKSEKRIIAALKIASEQRDKVNKYNDLSLLLAQTVYRWEESENDGR